MKNTLKFIKQTEESIEKMMSCEPKDRLEYVEALKRCWFAVQGSQKGWAAWIGNTSIFNMFDVDKIKCLYEAFRETTKAFLELDIEATKGYLAIVPELKKTAVNVGLRP